MDFLIAFVLVYAFCWSAYVALMLLIIWAKLPDTDDPPTREGEDDDPFDSEGWKNR